MTTDAPPPTRRARRATSTASHPIIVAAEAAEAEADGRAAAAPDVVAQPGGDVVATGAVGAGTLVVEQAAAPAGPLALAWVKDDELAPAVPPTSPASAPDLLAKAPRRSPLRAAVIVPVLLLALVVGAYSATTLLWPLHAVAPQIEAVPVQPVAAAAATPAWPATGGAAVSVAGIDGALASTGDASSIASITKVVTALVVLDRMPLAVGESGPEYRFTGADRTLYWQYRDNGESALDVPVGGVLTQYQLLEGMLIGSANNYADRLASAIWPSDAVFSSAANAWLASHGVPGITIVDPTGIEAGNTASPEALLALASRAMAHPVIAEIVARPSVSLPGAGQVENTNPLLADPGVVGIKTGSLDAFNLLAAKDVVIGDTTARIYASMLGQPDPETRNAALRAVFAQTEAELQLHPSVPVGTVAGRVVTLWGEPVDVMTTADASVVLWNGGSATTSTDFALDGQDTAGDAVGIMTVEGPLNRTSVDVALAGDVEPPSPWWRLTHPLDLFGLS